MKKKYAEEVAARIIEQLEQGTAPWQKPWKAGEIAVPYNASTGKEYRGMNGLLLTAQGYDDPRWMTYKQAIDARLHVRRGEKGTKVTYYKFQEEQQARNDQGKPIIGDDGKPKVITVELERPRFFHAIVFNGKQIDGLAPLEPAVIQPEPVRHGRAEAILTNSGTNIQHVAGDRAFYYPGTDSITLPQQHQFPTTESYYATALHELGHWTGHSSRLNRDLSHPFGFLTMVIFDGAGQSVPPAHLSVCPWMVDLGRMMFDIVFKVCVGKDMRKANILNTAIDQDGMILLGAVLMRMLKNAVVYTVTQYLPNNPSLDRLFLYH